MTNKEDLTNLVNIGKVTAQKLKQIGITTVTEFMARDPYQIFDELRQRVDPTLCRCALASIVGAKFNAPEYQELHPHHKWAT